MHAIALESGFGAPGRLERSIIPVAYHPPHSYFTTPSVHLSQSTCRGVSTHQTIVQSLCSSPTCRGTPTRWTKFGPTNPSKTTAQQRVRLLTLLATRKMG